MTVTGSADIAVIGAGVVGLAVSSKLVSPGREVFLIERHDSFGRETSSRNSEVIHAGIYYPADSLKRKTCVEGNRLLYEYCAQNRIPHRKTGKLIVAASEDEVPDLKALLEKGIGNGVAGLEMLSKKDIGGMEPEVRAAAAIFSPETGIIDTHSLMKDLERKFKGGGGTLSYNTDVRSIEKTKGGYKVTVNDADGSLTVLQARVLVNCAGLDSGRIAAMTGLDIPEYRIRPCKGDYFRLNPSKAKLIGRLVYPVPKKKGAGLGIHATPDLGGGVRLGPDEEYVYNIDYKVDVSKSNDFYESVKTFLPFITPDDLSPDTSGIRPKLQGPGEDFRDFVIREESDRGYPGLVDLIGIESPGLTACLSIACIVKKILDTID